MWDRQKTVVYLTLSVLKCSKEIKRFSFDYMIIYAFGRYGYCAD